MVEGKFDGDPGSAFAPMVPALIGWNQGVQTPFFILDTGFTGDLAVTKQMGKDLGLNFDGVLKLKTAIGEIRDFPAATVFAQMEGQPLYMTAIRTEGQPLLGITFLEKFNYKAVIDCENKRVLLEVAE